MKYIKLFSVIAILFTSLCGCSYIPAVAEVKVDPAGIKVFVGETADIDYTVLTEDMRDGYKPPAFKTIKEAAITTSFQPQDPDIVLIDTSGKALGLAPGETVVTITASRDKSSASGELRIVCKERMKNLSAIPESLQAEVGEELDLSGLCGEYVEWEALVHSSNPSVATCDKTAIKALAPGETTLTFTLRSETRTASFKAIEMVTEYELDRETLEGAAGDTASIGIGYRQPVTANGGLELTYVSSDEAVVTVDADGTVHFIAPGEATISAVNELGMESMCKVVVTEKKASATSSGGSGVAFIGSGPGGEIVLYDINGNVIQDRPPSGSSASAPSASGGYDTSIPAVAAVMDMVGAVYPCSEVAEAAAQAQGTTGWVKRGKYNILAPENFLSIGTKVAYSQVQPGDILYYADGGWGYSHVAVYIGDGMAVHGNFTSTGETKIASATYTTLTSVIHIG